MQAPGLPPRPGAVVSGSARFAAPTGQQSSDAARGQLEHQLDPASRRERAAARGGMGSGRPMLAGNQDPRRALPARDVRGARLSPYAGSRNEGV